MSTLLLIVEDEALIRDLLVTAFEDSGFEVLTADAAEQAFKLLLEHAGELSAVITDVNLGGASTGWDVARKAREFAPSLPVIYMTGDSAHQWPAQGVPGSVLLVKPFVPVQLITAVATLMNAATGNQAVGDLPAN